MKTKQNKKTTINSTYFAGRLAEGKRHERKGAGERKRARRKREVNSVSDFFFLSLLLTAVPHV